MSRTKKNNSIAAIMTAIEDTFRKNCLRFSKGAAVRELKWLASPREIVSALRIMEKNGSLIRIGNNEYHWPGTHFKNVFLARFDCKFCRDRVSGCLYCKGKKGGAE